MTPDDCCPGAPVTKYPRLGALRQGELVPSQSRRPEVEDRGFVGLRRPGSLRRRIRPCLVWSPLAAGRARPTLACGYISAASGSVLARPLLSAHLSALARAVRRSRTRRMCLYTSKRRFIIRHSVRRLQSASWRCREEHQLLNPSLKARGNCCPSSAQSGTEFWVFLLVVLSGSSTDWVRPTGIREGTLLCLVY